MQHSLIKIRDYIMSINGQIKELRAICKRQGAYSKFSYIANSNKKILYLINAKVASSSIKASVLQLEDQGFKQDYNKVHTEAIKWTKYIKNKSNFIKCYHKYYKFSFVRNPYERLVSCYENKYHTDKKYIGKSLAEFHFESYPFGFLKEDRGFNNFVIRVCLIPNKLADEHFRSQYYQLYTQEGKCLADYIGHYENIALDYEKICKKYGLCQLEHYNKATKGNWRDYYNSFTAWLVYQRFKKDFTQLGYGSEYKKLRAYIQNK